MKGNIYMYQVEKMEVLKNNIARIKKFFRELDGLEGPRACQSVVLFIDGYNHVPDELYEIKEVRNWINKLTNEIPHFFYYLNFSEEFQDNLYYILASISDNVQSYTSPEFRKPIDQFSMEEWNKAPKVAIQMRMNGKKMDKIIESILEHGERKNANEKGSIEVVNFLDSLFMRS